MSCGSELARDRINEVKLNHRVNPIASKPAPTFLTVPI